MSKRFWLSIIFVLVCSALLLKGSASAAFTAVPLPELGMGFYLDQQGGLYPGGLNVPPPAYLAQLEAEDCHDPATGKAIIPVIGMSMAQNALKGWQTFLNNPEVSDNLVVIDGTLGSDQQRFTNPDYFGWGIGLNRLNAAGYTAAQVKCVIYHNSWSGPSGEFVPYAEMVRDSFAVTMAIIKQKYPNVAVIYLNSRHYGLSPSSKQPEPYAYWEGWAVKWLIESRINCVSDCGALLAWNAYQWVPGWADHPEYYAADGLHLVGAGQVASGQIWHNYLSSTTFTAPWYLDGAPPPTSTPGPTAVPTSTPTPTGATMTPTPTNTASGCGRACQTATAAAGG